MSLKFNERIPKHLKDHPDQKFTAREIAEWLFENYREDCDKKREQSSQNLENDDDLLKQITAEIGPGLLRTHGRGEHEKIKTTEGRPRKYYYTESTDSAEVEKAESTEQSTLSLHVANSQVKEYDLYPVLVQYLRSEHRVFSKRIDERRSRNSRGPRGNKWLYPDLVGMEDLSEDWENEIKRAVDEYADKKSKLWSFEVKKLINRSNVREAFFQAVSNSSWANLGYLVAGEIEGADTLKELQILSSLHGIGFIKLDAENPSESLIMIPAREKGQIDWDTANRLVQENRDFSGYMEQVTDFCKTGNPRPEEWETFDEDEED